MSGSGAGDWWYTERNISSVIWILIVPIYVFAVQRSFDQFGF